MDTIDLQEQFSVHIRQTLQSATRWLSQWHTLNITLVMASILAFLCDTQVTAI
ncbi:MAG: hypothetical protein R3332_09550 [Pseudohongiellaceae bacterium]|nr:hypothetical protein [Pseudohongiellaceae bacterium]